MPIEIVFLITHILLLVVLSGIVYFSYLERQKLLDRIMAKNYPEYVDNKKPEENNFSDGQENFIELEEAQKEVLEA